MARLGMALTVAVLGLAMSTAAAAADPTEQPPPAEQQPSSANSIPSTPDSPTETPTVTSPPPSDTTDPWTLATLAADLEFTKDTYRPDESPTVRVRLFNDGGRSLEGITAWCWSSYAYVTDATWATWRTVARGSTARVAAGHRPAHRPRRAAPRQHWRTPA